jgi:transcriptional regulator with XRE-family HTH domain
MKKPAPNPIDVHVGARIRMRRRVIGMSQGTLSNALGLTWQQVQKYEKGTNRVGSSRLKQIADILEVPVHFFFEGAPGYSAKRAEKADPLAELGSTHAGIDLAVAFNAITDARMRAAIVELAQAAASGRRKTGRQDG